MIKTNYKGDKMTKKKKVKKMKVFAKSKLEEMKTFITDDGQRMPIYIITPDGEKHVHLDYVRQEMAKEGCTLLTGQDKKSGNKNINPDKKK